MAHLKAQQSSSFSRYDKETEGGLMFLQSGDVYSPFIDTASENIVAFPPDLSNTSVDPNDCSFSYFPNIEAFRTLPGPGMDVDVCIFDNENRYSLDEVASAGLMTTREIHTTGFSEVQGIDGQTLDDFQTEFVSLPTIALTGPPSLLSPSQHNQRGGNYLFNGSRDMTTDDTPMSGTSTSLPRQRGAQLGGLEIPESPSSGALFPSRVASEHDSLRGNGQHNSIADGEIFGTESMTLHNQTSKWELD
jgi:hypothetical protein